MLPLEKIKEANVIPLGQAEKQVVHDGFVQEGTEHQRTQLQPSNELIPGFFLREEARTPARRLSFFQPSRSCHQDEPQLGAATARFVSEMRV